MHVDIQGQTGLQKIRVSYNQEFRNINIKLVKFIQDFMINPYQVQQEPEEASQLPQHTELDAYTMDMV